MGSTGRPTPTPLLLEPGYWRRRLDQMKAAHRGLLILPRPDLSSPLIDVVEWRLRAHDGTRLWGLRGGSPFHPKSEGAWIREVNSCELPEICLDSVTEGCLDFVWQVPAGRKLEDRVLDVLRVWQVAVSYSGLSPDRVRLVAAIPGEEPDEFMIAARLLSQGIFSAESAEDSNPQFPGGSEGSLEGI
ncbi:MAG: hypothetical protein IPK67_21005 [Planctomycetes bacterium]|nr:hypothetical protein [Planctomycetota bacterium]